jgi:hypothetical protein
LVGVFLLSGRRDSNSRPSAWKADALPTELLPRLTYKELFGGQGRVRTSVGRSPADLQSAPFNHFGTCPSILSDFQRNRNTKLDIFFILCKHYFKKSLLFCNYFQFSCFFPNFDKVFGTTYEI